MCIKGRNADALAIYFGEDPTRCPFEQGLNLLVIINLYFHKYEWMSKKIHVISCPFQLECIWMVPRMQVDQFWKRWLQSTVLGKLKLHFLFLPFHLNILKINIHTRYPDTYASISSIVLLDTILKLDSCKIVIDLKLYATALSLLLPKTARSHFMVSRYNVWTHVLDSNKCFSRIPTPHIWSS